MLKEKAVFYYGTKGLNCAESMVWAARDAYGWDISDEQLLLFKGFGGGMGCGSTCGALTGSVAVLSLKYKDHEDVKGLCGAFVEKFEKKFGVQDCETISSTHKTEEARCVAAVEKTADLLLEYMDELDGKTKVEDASECTLTPEQIKSVKGLGFLHHKGTNNFNGRIITRNGKVTAEESRVISEAAEKFGDGHMMFTTRLTIEVSGIPFDQIENFRAYIAKVGLETGGTGSLVRPVVSCKGTTCQYGLYDTYALSDEIHERFYKGYRTVSLPHKFKIATGGCPNNCVKPNLNDVGIVGAKIPNFDVDTCRGCKKCQIEDFCPMKAAKVVDGKLQIDPEICNNCGRCVGRCPFKCIEDGTYGWQLYIGGRWGKKVNHGRALNHIFTNKAELLDAVEKCILFFRSEGISGERFADTVNRVGFEKAEAMILGDELLQRKNEIIGLNVVGGASC